MQITHVLIDYENVQPKSMAILDLHDYRLIVFVGASQSKLTFAVADVVQRMGERARYIQITGNGSNSLDFHIAFYVGRLSTVDPAARFYIVSKDTGFDPLIAQLVQQKILACRVKAVTDISGLASLPAELPSIEKSATTDKPVKATKANKPEKTDVPEQQALILKNLKQRGSARPWTLKTLTSTISSLFKPKPYAKELEAILKTFQERKWITFDGQKVTYSFPNRLWPLALSVLLITAALPAFAWGDEGHKIIALIAAHDLSPTAAERVDELLSADDSGLVATDLASESTWADRYRDSDRSASRKRYDSTREWHYVDVEIDGSADIDSACFNHPGLPQGTFASEGTGKACIIDKIDAFLDELLNSKTPIREQTKALQFVLHLVGDLHQPLHVVDDHDSGGNARQVSAVGFPNGNLHHYWDTEFVQRLGPNPEIVAAALIKKITADQRSAWSQGTTREWAEESFSVASKVAYGKLGEPDSAGRYVLSPEYVSVATNVVAEQLSRARVRLAYVLNESFADR